MIASVQIYDFVIIYVIQNMHCFCVILHGNYKIHVAGSITERISADYGWPKWRKT